MGSLFEIFVERYSWLILEEDIISNFSIAYCIHLWLVCLFQGCIYLMGALLMQATYLLFQILNDFSSCLISHIICIQYRWVIGSRSAWAMYNLFSYQKKKKMHSIDELLPCLKSSTYGHLLVCGVVIIIILTFKVPLFCWWKKSSFSVQSKWWHFRTS